MLHLLLLTLFYVTNGFNGRCANMTTIGNKECAAAAMKYFNYTLAEISRMRYLHALILGLCVDDII